MNGLSFDKNLCIAPDDCTFTGSNYRITVLTERLVRLEFSDTGNFVDDPTEIVWFRNFSKPQFSVDDNTSELTIKTKYFELNYKKEKTFEGSKFFPTSNLKINLVGTNKFWYYKHPEVRYFQVGSFNNHDKVYNQKGLFSQDGFISIDDSNSMLFNENGTLKNREDKSIDIYVFMYGNDFEACLHDYYDLTGWPGILPRYAYGIWYNKNVNYSQKQVYELIYDFKKNEVPLSVLVLNNWSKQDNQFDQNLYPDISKFINKLRENSIHLCLNLNPVEKGIIDYDKYLSNLNNLDNLGVDFYKINYFDTKKLKELMHLKHYTYYNNINNKNKRPMILAQSNLQIPHKYPVLYSGQNDVSWESLKKIALYNASNYNIGCSYITHDFGGYSGGIEDRELMTRYIQLGVFSPILKLSSDSSKYYIREPWNLGTKTSKITRKYLKLRQKLIPYIYSESYKYHAKGIPFIKPIYNTYKEFYDDTIYDSEYYFGSEIFVSPITNHKDYVMNRVIHKAYLPEGVWYNFNNGQLVPGGKKHTSFYRDEDYPIYVKAGGIIPFNADVDKDINSYGIPKTMEIHVFPGANNVYSLYEDDGISNSYLEGNYIISNIEYRYRSNNYAITVRPIKGKRGIIPDKRNYKIVFRNTKKADKVNVHLNALELPFISYTIDNDFFIEIKDVSTTEQLIVECFGDNIEVDALHIINTNIQWITSDLPIETNLKEQVDKILFSSDSIKVKRIKIRQIKKLEKKYVELFLKLLEYINGI